MEHKNKLSSRIVISAHFDPSLPSGGSKYSIDLTRVWLEEGHTVHVFCSFHKRELLDLEDYYLSNTLYIHTINDSYINSMSHEYNIVVYNNAAELIKEIRPEAIYIHNFHGLVGAMWAAVESGYKTIYSALDFGLICLNWYLYNGTYSISCTGPETKKCKECLIKNTKLTIKTKILSVLPSYIMKIIGKEHLLYRQYRYVNRYNRKASTHLEKTLPLLKRFDAILVLSPIVRRILLYYGAHSERIHFLTQGINSYDLQKDERDYANEVRIVYLGHLHNIKGFQVIVKALEGLPDNLNLKIILYCNGANIYVKNCSLSARRYLDYSDLLIGAEVENELRKSEALIIPSLWHENSPYAVIRALAVGRPVIASNQEGISHLIQHQVNGLLISPGDISAWSKVLRQVSEHPEVLRKMRINCYYKKTVAIYAKEVQEIVENL